MNKPIKAKLIPFNKLPQWAKDFARKIADYTIKKEKDSKFDKGFTITIRSK